MKLIKYFFARLLKWQMEKGFDLKQVDELSANKWNHLNSLILTKGRIKIDWYKLRRIPVQKCNKCLKIMAIHVKPVREKVCDGCK